MILANYYSPHKVRLGLLSCSTLTLVGELPVETFPAPIAELNGWFKNSDHSSPRLTKYLHCPWDSD
jgi:hypothetical protein